MPPCTLELAFLPFQSTNSTVSSALISVSCTSQQDHYRKIDFAINSAHQNAAGQEVTGIRECLEACKIGAQHALDDFSALCAGGESYQPLRNTTRWIHSASQLVDSLGKQRKTSDEGNGACMNSPTCASGTSSRSILGTSRRW